MCRGFFGTALLAVVFCGVGCVVDQHAEFKGSLANANAGGGRPVAAESDPTRRVDGRFAVYESFAFRPAESFALLWYLVGG